MVRQTTEAELEREQKEKAKKSLPWWAWLFPIFFGALGGIGSCIAFRKRLGAGWLFIIGVGVQGISIIIINFSRG